MPGNRFFDTNVLIYAFTAHDPRGIRAEELLTEVFLQFVGQHVAERGVQALGLVDLLDGWWRLCGDIDEGFVAGHIKLLDLECIHEAPRRSIGLRISRGTHGSEQHYPTRAPSVMIFCQASRPRSRSSASFSLEKSTATPS